MNIPLLGGLGQRFKDVGYESPKPLIKALGKEIIIWLLDSLKTDKFDNVFIVYNKELSVFGFESFFTDKDIKLFKLSRNTQGLVETCYEFLSLLPQKQQNEKLLILDGDTFYKFDLLRKIRKLKYSSVVFSDTTLSKPIYSYIKEKNGNLTDIKEKIKISNKFNIGAYFFESAYQFLSYSRNALKKNKGSYISQIYFDLIKSKKKVKAVYISNKFFTCLGTPDQLISFCTQNSNLIKKSFCFDLNSIINLSSTANNKFLINKPLENQKFLKMLKKQGHSIIIQSSKLSEKKNKVLKSLKDLNIPYDKISFSKPIADYFIEIMH